MHAVAHECEQYSSLMMLSQVFSMHAVGNEARIHPREQCALQPPHVVVVGGGVGGLATAGRLAKRGARVTVLEKNDKVGGRVGEYSWQQHRWETGASLLLLPDVYRDALEAAPGAAQLDIKRVAPAYAVWYEQHADRGPVILGGDRGDLRRRLELEAPGGLSVLRSTGRRRASTCGRAGRSSLRRIFLPHPWSNWYHGSSPRLSRTLWKWPLFGPRRAAAPIVPGLAAAAGALFV